ncbi:uncharacterized protein LOC121758209 isoform X1 [Salvia splendens]|uniref:uncharacterized protein LOC121758209 isoform X1 n=1 Tax=Salvia splendens TaxID=180675 RepID=UPI001102EA2B|nr:uncharacterized protein LOC121758209 isoform X1 [Salvia splendens]
MWQQLRAGWLQILNIQKSRRIVSYTGFYCFATLINFAYTNNTFWFYTCFSMSSLHQEKMQIRLFIKLLVLWRLIRTRAGHSRADQFYASYPAGTELLTDTGKLYKAALGNCFEIEEWGPIEWSILAKHFERQGKSPYAYHSQYMAHLASLGQLDGSC